MSVMRQFLLITKLSTILLVRIPAYAIPTMVMPAMVYAFFGLPYSTDPMTARFLMASYAAFAVIGVALFQFGVGIANERAAPWSTYVRTLAAPMWVAFCARIAAAMIFASAATLIICVMAVAFAHVSMPLVAWVLLAVALLTGSVVFALIGISIGYWTNPTAAMPIANLIYLPFAFVGGLWLPPQYLPHFVAAISPFTPTRQYGELLWASVSGQPWTYVALLTLAAYAVVFAFIAMLGYRRDEGVRYA